ncbi:uncharacterized protein TNCV_4822611 [Trichonephila clavipes]|nr:uncharacterized protein TNCV_4822611 [Trichonephila clavipes]
MHSTIVEDRKAREENVCIEEQKEKLRIEEREENLRIEEREENLRIEQLRWIEDRYFQQVIGSNPNRSTQTKNSFEFKEYYLDEWANMNSPVQLAEKLEEFEDFKRTLKQKSSRPFVKKQEFRFTEKNRRYEAPGKFEYNRKDKKFPASTNYNKHYEAPVTKYENLFKDIKTARRKGIATKITRNTQITMLPSMLRRTIQNRRNSKNLQKKLAHSSRLGRFTY